MSWSRRTRRIVGWTLAGITAAFLLWPHERPVAPRWEVRVRTLEETPAVGVKVWEFSRDYSVERDGSYVEKQTDDAGLVVFDSRVLHTSYLSLAMHIVWEQAPDLYALASSHFRVRLGPECHGGVLRTRETSSWIVPANIDQHGVAHTDARL
jgi:hypothetical protein